MKSAGVADLKANLSSYLKKVKAGQEVLITERGLPVARLAPLEGEAERSARVRRLVKAGLVIPGRGKIRPSLLVPPKGDPAVGASVLAALLEEREQGR